MILKMMNAAFDDIVQVAAALLLLNLNHPIGGVYDPDAGMHVVHPRFRSEKGSKASQNYRMGMAFRFADDISQAALTGESVTRRTRQKGGGKTTQGSSDQGGGIENVGSTGL